VIDRETISGDEAMELIKNNQPIIDKVVVGQINLTNFLDDSNNFSVIIDNSAIDELLANSVNFSKQVILRSSTFKKCEFQFTYFLGGLLIKDSTFDSYLDFQCGGHNQPQIRIEILNNEFNGFVNFFDCIYNGPVTIKNNEFKRGTNVLGNKGKAFETQFDLELEITDNRGQVDIDGEGQ
jgi:hypothetical protein